MAYRGTGPALNDLIGGHVDFFCEQAVSVAPQITGGAIKAYGVSAGERLAALPDVPTAKEAGVDYQMSIWAGIFAPKGTPKEVVDKLAHALDKALDDPGVQGRLAELGGSIPAQDERTPAKFDAFVKAEIARWSPDPQGGRDGQPLRRSGLSQVQDLRNVIDPMDEQTCRRFSLASTMFRRLNHQRVRFWHLADNSVASAFVRYWSNSGHWSTHPMWAFDYRAGIPIRDCGGEAGRGVMPPAFSRSVDDR